MKNLMKRELLNDVVTGLLVAATFSAVIPADALAALTNSVDSVQQNVAKPAMQFLGIIAYAVGAVITVAGIAGAKKHADNPGSNPLGPAVGKLLAGGAFLAAPSVVGALQETGTAAIQGQAQIGTPSTFGF